MGRAALVTWVLVALGCGTTGFGSELNPVETMQVSTIRVTNKAHNDRRVYFVVGDKPRFLGTVRSSMTRCFRLLGTESRGYVRVTGMGMQEPARSLEFDTLRGTGWAVEISEQVGGEPLYAQGADVCAGS